MERDIEIGDEVRILDSAIVGTVAGLSIVRTDEIRFLVEYVDGTGTPVEKWWPEPSLTVMGEQGGGTPATNVIFAAPLFARGRLAS